MIQSCFVCRLAIVLETRPSESVIDDQVRMLIGGVAAWLPWFLRRALSMLNTANGSEINDVLRDDSR
jgi:hypothetical protein